jgi:hypothetical protein
MGGIAVGAAAALVATVVVAAVAGGGGEAAAVAAALVAAGVDAAFAAGHAATLYGSTHAVFTGWI